MSQMGDLGDIFETFFGGGFGGGGRKTYTHGSDLELTQEISLEDVFRGVRKELAIPTLIMCTTCKGEGGDQKAGSTTCETCNGRGEIKEKRKTFFGSFAQVRECSKCHGVGKIPNKPCETCKGSGRVRGERMVKLDIVPGIQDGQVIQVRGAGEAGERGVAAGDLYVRVRVKPHKVFERRGDDLLIKKELSIADLLLGRKIEAPLIDGGVMHIEVPAKFNLKDVFHISGKGMPRFGSFGRGDLLLDFIVKAPKPVSGKAKEQLEKLLEE